MKTINKWIKIKKWSRANVVLAKSLV